MSGMIRPPVVGCATYTPPEKGSTFGSPRSCQRAHRQIPRVKSDIHPSERCERRKQAEAIDTQHRSDGLARMMARRRGSGGSCNA
eukprot:1596093-Rhodomonas_salina.1